MPIIQHTPLILASGSAIRAQMLKAVGLNFSVVPSAVDEEAIKRRFTGDDWPLLAADLARAKALGVAKDYPEHLTIGADQLCVCEGDIVDKPGSFERAESQLRQLSGRTHRQYSGVCLARGDAVLWETVERADLTMRVLSDAAITAYVAADEPLASCGSYRFEGLGRHLFERVEGDQDVIKGLPLLPLLATLHRVKAIAMG